MNKKHLQGIASFCCKSITAASLLFITCVRVWDPSEVIINPIAKTSFSIFWQSDSIGDPAAAFIHMKITTAHGKSVEKLALPTACRLTSDTLFLDNPVTVSVTVKSNNQTSLFSDSTKPFSISADASYYAVLKNRTLSPPKKRHTFITTTDSLYTLGKMYYEHTLFKIAAIYFDSVTARLPRDSFTGNAFYHLGRIAFRQKEYNKALSAFDTVVMRFPQNRYYAYAKYYRCRTLFESGNISGSLNLFKEFRDGFPNHPKIEYTNYYIALCTYLSDTINCGNAIALFTSFVSEYPGSNLITPARFYLAKSYYHNRIDSAAIYWFSQMLDPDTALDFSTEAHLYRGKCYVNRGGAADNYTKAVDDLVFVLKDSSHVSLFKYAYEPLGIASFHLDQYLSAKHYLLLAKNNQPSDSGYYYLIRTTILNGNNQQNCDQARSFLGEMESIIPSPNKFIDQAKKYIDENCK
jgi:TolA-binding protein